MSRVVRAGLCTLLRAAVGFAVREEVEGATVLGFDSLSSALLAIAFLSPLLLSDLLLAGDFFAVVFLAVVFLAVVFLAVVLATGADSTARALGFASPLREF